MWQETRVRFHRVVYEVDRFHPGTKLGRSLPSAVKRDPLNGYVDGTTARDMDERSKLPVVDNVPGDAVDVEFALGDDGSVEYPAVIGAAAAVIHVVAVGIFERRARPVAGRCRQRSGTLTR